MIATTHRRSSGRLGYGLALVYALWPLGCDESSDQECPSGMVRSGGLCTTKPVESTPSSPVALNTVGFFPNRIKRATVLQAAETFSVIRSDGTEARSGLAVKGPTQDEAGRPVWVADFSDLREPGTFLIRVPGVGDSPAFAISEDAYKPLVETLMAGFYGWRCGTEITLDGPNGPIHHGACHMKDAVMDAVNFGTDKDGTRKVQGGWHDAGDYGKYVVNGAFSASIMLKALEYYPQRIQNWAFAIPEAADLTLPDYLDEIAWELDWMLKMQFEDGGVSLQVQTSAWPAMVGPTEDQAAQHITSTATVSTAYFAAVMAEAARVYAPYDPKRSTDYLAAAQLANGYLQAHPEPVKAQWANIINNAYGSAREEEARMWAAIELWETTGNSANLTDFEQRAQAARIIRPRTNWDWPNSANLAIYTYLLSQRPEKDQRNAELLATLRSGAVTDADGILASAASDVYGNGLPHTYYWGINGVTARLTVNLAVAYRLTQDPKYLDGVVTQVDHLLGRNYYSRSQVTGIGFMPPLNPHHRPSKPSSPYPGLLVGGPNAEAGNSKVTDWNDSASDFYSNEVAINWNASLVFGAIVAAEPAEPSTIGLGGAGGAGGAGGSAEAGGLAGAGPMDTAGSGTAQGSEPLAGIGGAAAL